MKIKKKIIKEIYLKNSGKIKSSYEEELEGIEEKKENLMKEEESKGEMKKDLANNNSSIQNVNDKDDGKKTDIEEGKKHKKSKK